MRFKRILLIALSALVVIGVGAWLLARHYLHSPAVTHEVTERLEAMYGGPVKVGEVHVGVGGSSLSGFELFEQGSDTQHATPWLTVGSIDTDVSLWELVRGRAVPKHVTLKQVKILLRFDADGHLITRFPHQQGTAFDPAKLKEMPEVVLEGGEVVLHKEGQPELVAQHVSAKLTRDANGKIVLAGTGDSAGLGKLLLDGSVAPPSAEAVVTLKTAGVVPVSQPLLLRVPFVPAITWRELKVAKGESSTALTVHYNLHGDHLHWRLALAPQKTTARIPVLDLEAHDATGSIVVNDYRIDLHDIQGKAYGGRVRLDGSLDFSTSTYKFDFPKIKLTSLDVAKVPDSWNPAELDTLRQLAPEGKLTGTASVLVTMHTSRVKPAVVDSFIGLTAASSSSESWLPALTALAAFPHRETRTESTGKATITGIAGGTAEIDLKLGPQPTHPVSAPTKSSRSIPKGSERLAGGRAPARPPAARRADDSTPEGSERLAGGRAPARPPEDVAALSPTPKGSQSLPARAATPPGSNYVVGRPPVVERALDHRLISPTPPGSKSIRAMVVAFQPPAGPQAYPEVNAKVARALGKLLGGIHSTMRDIIAVGSETVASVPKKIVPPRPVTPETPTTYLDLNLKLKDVDLALLVKGLRIKLNAPVGGKLSVQVKVSIPTNRASNLKEYKLQGTAQMRQLQFDGIHVATLDSNIRYQNGVLDLTGIKGRMVPPEKGQPPEAGTFIGRGSLQVVPLGPASAELTLDRVPIGAVAGPIAAKERLGGTLSGTLALHGPANKLKDIAAFAGNGKLTIDRPSALGFAIGPVTTAVELKGGVLRLIDLHSTFEGTPIAASAELRLSGDYAFKAKADLKNWDLAALEKLAAKGQEPPVKIAGTFTTTANVQGTLQPFTLNASGDAAAAALTVDKLRVAKARFHWTTNGKALDLAKLDVELYGGAALGSAVLPLQATAGGAVNLKLSDLDAQQLVKDLALPVKIKGKVGGVVKGTLPPVPAGKTRIGTFDLAVTAPALTVDNIPTEQLRGKLDYKNGIVDYKLEGKTLGGTFEVEGQVPRGEPVKKESGKGKLRINNVSLFGLSKALGLKTAPIAGRLSVELDYTQAALNQMPEGTGKLRLTDLRWHGAALSPNLAGDLVLSKGLLELRRVTGEIAQGIARFALIYDLRNPNRSQFTLDLQNVQAEQLLAPWTGKKITGTMQAHIRGALGRTWRGKANLELTAGKVADMELSQWRFPAEWSYSPATRRAAVRVYATDAHVARGRMQGKLDATWDYGWSLTGSARFFSVDLQTLMRQFTTSTTIAAGTVTGEFSFNGTNVHSIDDLAGTLVASFSQAQVLQIPGLSAITPFIGMGPTTTFQKGGLRARLDHGVLRIQRLALTGGTFKLFADGTVSLAGALNLNVVAKTGSVGLPTCRLGLISLRIPIAGPLPITLLQDVSNLLANQVVYLQVTGTIRSPVVRVQLLRMLTEEAVRFFLIEANLPIPLAP